MPKTARGIRRTGRCWRSRTAVPAAREGDQIKITHVGFDGDKLLVEVNGGLKTGDKWYDHIQIRHGRDVASRGGRGPATLGTTIEVNFHKPLENLNSDQIKKILAPLMDFDKHTVTKVYAETLPPEMQKAISEKRALEGMSRDEVLMAMGIRCAIPRNQGRCGSGRLDLRRSAGQGDVRDLLGQQSGKGERRVRGAGHSGRPANGNPVNVG